MTAQGRGEFGDISHLSQEAQDAIRWSARAGLLRGTGDEQFSPDEPLTRWQQAIILERGINFARMAARRFRPVTVTLFNSNTNRTGAGFFINSLGDILTNQHCILGDNNHQYPWTQYIRADWGLIRSANTEPWPTIVYDLQDQTDLAVIRLHADHRAKLPQPLPLVPFDDDDPVEGERCVAIGSPLSYANWISEGIVALYPIAVATNPGKWIGVTAGINPGNSGGPVISLDQRVLGIATLKPWTRTAFGMTHGDDMGLVFAASEIRAWLGRHRIPVG